MLVFLLLLGCCCCCCCCYSDCKNIFSPIHMRINVWRWGLSKFLYITWAAIKLRWNENGFTRLIFLIHWNEHFWPKLKLHFRTHLAENQSLTSLVDMSLLDMLLNSLWTLPYLKTEINWSSKEINYIVFVCFVSFFKILFALWHYHLGIFQSLQKLCFLAHRWCLCASRHFHYYLGGGLHIGCDAMFLSGVSNP